MSARKHGYFRRPRTTQERRWNEAHRKYVRGRRSPKLIPCCWEDQFKSRGESKSWKDKFKKRHQWDEGPFKEGWLLRHGFWNTINCRTNLNTHRYRRVYRCPGCHICHTRKASTYKKRIKGRKKG
jgi:hypothetical protein